MSFVQDNRHAFVIQLWREPREIEGAPEQWRGTIEHIPSGRRSAIFTTDDITQFINNFAALLDSDPAIHSSLRTRLRRHLAGKSPGDEPPPTE